MRTILLGAAVLFVAGSIILFGVRSLAPVPTAFEAKCLRVQPRMTVGEVEAIFDWPPRPVARMPSLPGCPGIRGDVLYGWNSGYDQVYVGFAGGRVVDKWYYEWTLQ